VEILKQPQYKPMPVEEQVVLIFAGTKGYLDEFPVEHLKHFEAEFLEAMRTKYAEMLGRVREEKALSPDVEKALVKAIEEFCESFRKEFLK
jgi:F-type H+-transporting ATPase subunit alpha